MSANIKYRLLCGKTKYYAFDKLLNTQNNYMSLAMFLYIDGVIPTSFWKVL